MVTARDLRLLAASAEVRARAHGALGRQSRDSVGYSDCVDRKARADRKFERLLARIRAKAQF